MKMMQRVASGRYEVLNSPGPLREFSEKSFFEQVLSYAHSLKASSKEPVFLVFCSTEEWRVIQLLRQIRTDKRPSVFPGDHQSSPIRAILDELLQPHGLVSELVPENGDPETPIIRHRLAITNLHRA